MAGRKPISSPEDSRPVTRREVARWTARRAIARRAGLPDQNIRRDFKRGMAAIIDEHRRLWLERSRYGGLEESTSHYTRQIWRD